MTTRDIEVLRLIGKRCGHRAEKANKSHERKDD
jgi:hypothetical protein